ncbi:hypothetical protein ATK78_2403 [Pedobacter metabolipauper]|uniref:Uncharacterized protein n=1 Tax=Pedobacter metabolipauper TaxID=425513 RepID=A0A4R6SWB7_9SPHI|nr:hypothetical protein ATK78_2403 [Pedobacter metabolipauper]
MNFTLWNTKIYDFISNYVYIKQYLHKQNKKWWTKPHFAELKYKHKVIQL